MGGYNEDTGIFELTSTKAHYWLRRSDYGHLAKEISEVGVIQAVLEWQGLEVIKNGGGYWHVRGTPEQIWEALSGQPSNPDNAKHYYKSKRGN